MTIKIRLNQILFFLIFAAIFALSFAYVSQYFFGHQPCNLCLYQRKPFFLIIAICALTLAFFKSKKSKQIAILLSLLTLIINASIAVYHVGVEKKIFKISESCSSTHKEEYSSLKELETAIMTAPTARCDEPTFFFLGLSMAVWNIFYCLGLAIFVTFLYRAQKERRSI